MATDRFFNCMSPKGRREAKAVCEGCPVRAQCLERALAEEATRQSPAQNLKSRFGVRGGLTGPERWALVYPEAAQAALDKDARRTRGRPNRIAAELAAA
jgi:hypothetical protein